MEMGGEIFKNLQSGAPFHSVPKSSQSMKIYYWNLSLKLGFLATMFAELQWLPKVLERMAKF